MIPLEEMEVYQLSMKIGEGAWKVVTKWDYFAKDTIGKQMVRSADSVAANFAEGYGRYFYKDRRLYCYYCRGSLMETKTWMTKAKNRNLVSEATYQNFLDTYILTLKKLNSFISQLNKNIK